MSAMAAPAVYFTTALDQAKEDLLRRGVEIFDFGVGDPVEPTPAFIRQALIDALDPVSQYPTVVGQKQLRTAVAGWAKRRLDVTLDPGTQVLPASGSKEAIFHLPLAVLGRDEPRRRIIYPSPSYPVYEGSALFSGAIPHPVVLSQDNGFRLDLRALDAAEVVQRGEHGARGRAGGLRFAGAAFPDQELHTLPTACSR